MSPASSRRYIVGFESWTVYQTVVLAKSKDEAIAKGKALYDLNGLGEFSVSDGAEGPWHAQHLDREGRF